MRSLIGDLCIVLGSALVLTGVWWMYPPAALIVGGLCGLAAGAKLYGAI